MKGDTGSKASMMQQGGMPQMQQPQPMQNPMQNRMGQMGQIASGIGMGAQGMGNAFGAMRNSGMQMPQQMPQMEQSPMQIPGGGFTGGMAMQSPEVQAYKQNIMQSQGSGIGGNMMNMFRGMGRG